VFDFLKKRPMLLCAIVASALSVMGIYSETALLYFCPLLLFAIFMMFYNSVKGEIILAFILVLAVGVSTLFSLKSVKQANLLDNLTCTGEFVVVEQPENHGDYYSTTLQTINCGDLKKNSKIAVTFSSGEMHLGEYLNAKVKLSSLQESSAKYSYYSNNILLRGYVKSHKSLEKSDFVLKTLGNIRSYIKESIFEIYGNPEAATMVALLTGNKGYFTNDFYANVKSAGVAHVMVVSGMHLSVIVALALYLTKKLFYNRYFKALLILFVTLSVMAVCGFTMSIMRAGITYIIMALALIIGRENTPENTLGAAVSLILLFDPFAIKNVAFLLSVLSTFAILVVALPASEYITQNILKKPFFAPIVSSVLISFSALVFTSPITIYVFGYVSNVSVITNLLTSLAVSVAMYLCILGFLIPFLKPLLFFLSSMVVKYINFVINYFGELPFATINTPKWLAFVMVGVIVLILWLLIACKEKQNVLLLREMRFKKYVERGKIKWQ
jgi:ComEC/Rec2-related protein